MIQERKKANKQFPIRQGRKKNAPSDLRNDFETTRFEEHQQFFSSKIWVIRTQVIAATDSRIR